MVANNPKLMNGSARSRETCIKEYCDAEVSTTLGKREGQSVEIKRCANGHIRKPTIDVDGSTYDAFRALSAIPGP